MTQNLNNQKRVVFSGLDELRAVAALAVVVHHIALYKHRDGLPSLYQTFAAPVVSRLGVNGVNIFFVLSGFLISYLLLTEKGRFGTIHLARFYMRRLLRIWPLYFLVFFLSFFVLPFLASHLDWLQGERHYNRLIEDLINDPVPRLLLFLLFLPNLALRVGKPVVGASQSWSVGVEEQFYAIWPLLLKTLSQRGALIGFIIIAFGYPLSPEVMAHLSPQIAGWLDYLVKLFPVHLMALGACAAHQMYYHGSQFKAFTQSPVVFILNTLLLIYLMSVDVPSILFGLIVAVEIVFLVQKGFRFNLRNRYLAKIGTVSYGFYMLHPMVMFFSFGLLNTLMAVDPETALYHLLSYGLVIGGSLILSYLSYVGYERRFIRLKNRLYSVVPSGRA